MELISGVRAWYVSVTEKGLGIFCIYKLLEDD
jgi:hypothetical protein